MFTTGQKVVCLNSEFPEAIKSLYKALPVQDGIYTVRSILAGIALDNKTHEVAVLLEELVNPLDSAKVPQERAFNVERFAPLETTEDEEEESHAEPAKKERELALV